MQPRLLRQSCHEVSSAQQSGRRQGQRCSREFPLYRCGISLGLSCFVQYCRGKGALGSERKSIDVEN